MIRVSKKYCSGCEIRYQQSNKVFKKKIMKDLFLEQQKLIEKVNFF